jgi:hypothetical protein
MLRSDEFVYLETGGCVPGGSVPGGTSVELGGGVIGGVLPSWL